MTMTISQATVSSKWWSRRYRLLLLSCRFLSYRSRRRFFLAVEQALPPASSVVSFSVVSFAWPVLPRGGAGAASSVVVEQALPPASSVVSFDSPRAGNIPIAAFDSPRVGNVSIVAFDSPRVGNVSIVAFDSPRVGNVSIAAFDSPRVGDIPIVAFDSPRVGNISIAAFDSPRAGNAGGRILPPVLYSHRIPMSMDPNLQSRDCKGAVTQSPSRVARGRGSQAR